MEFVNLFPVFPILVLAGGSLLLLVLGVFFQLKYRLAISLLTCAVSWGYLSVVMVDPRELFGGLLAMDPFTFVFGSIILIGTALTLMLNHGTLKRQGVHDSIDIDVLILLASCGGLMMVSATNLLVLFLGFELLSVCVYVLAGLARAERASSEGALKYFLLGAFSSAFLLYGMALVYGATGSLHLRTIADNAEAENLMLLAGIGFLLFGFGFKASLVPFHFWAPDAYQGSPTSFTGYMATVVKAAAFGCFLRVFLTSFGVVSEVFAGLLWVIAVVTMTGGNLIALRQKSVKRMLAYSSIAHAGYALMGFLVLDDGVGAEAVLFYLFTYLFMTITSFGVLLLATAGTHHQYERDDVRALQGLGWTHPVLGLCMSIALLSLAGVPPLAGFVGKFYLFTTVISNGYIGLAVIAAVNSVISLYYYLNVIVAMYFGESSEAGSPVLTANTFIPQLALILSTLATLYIGLFSSGAYAYARVAIEKLSL